MPCVSPEPVYYNSLPKGVCDGFGGEWWPETAQGFAAARAYMDSLLNPEPQPGATLGLGDSLPERIRPETDVCGLASRWLIVPRLAERLVALSGRLEFGIDIISGYRSPAKQQKLAAAGKPTASLDTSTHLTCPATGADLWPSVAPVRAVKHRLNAEATLLGLRVGGGSARDPKTGLPSDWNHVDLGPRSSHPR